MEREQAQAGMQVVFGRAGEKTVGKIVAVNPARAKVETLEVRAGRPAGTRFNVPYALMQPADDERAPAS